MRFLGRHVGRDVLPMTLRQCKSRSAQLTNESRFQTDPPLPACMRTKSELCSLYVLKQGGGDVEGFCRGSSGFGVDRAVCRDDRDMGPGASQSVGSEADFGSRRHSNPVRFAPLGKSLTAAGERARLRGLKGSEPSRWRAASRVRRLGPLHNR